MIKHFSSLSVCRFVGLSVFRCSYSVYTQMFLILLASLFMMNHCTYMYDESIAKIAVNLSQASYCVSSSWTCMTCDKTNTLETIVETHGERVLLGYNTVLNALFVSFRGSSNIQNWIDNVQFRKVYPYNDSTIAVEKGFYKAYQNVKPDVLSAMNTIQTKYSTNTVLLTGHSLGAAIATLMTFDLFDSYDILLYTFGSPRVGNEQFVSSFDHSIPLFRIVHYYDVVPHLPQELLGFLHIPQEIWYTEDNVQYKTCNDDFTQEDDTCSNSCSPLHCTSTSDHLNYLGIPMGSSNGLC